VSDYLAVAGVSAVLQWMLTDSLSSGGPQLLLGSSSPGVTVGSPDLITTGADEPPQLNLFMYYVSINPALRNLGLPAAGPGSVILSNPPLALNLHYLVTAYGAKQFDPEILLAYAMKVFHDQPVISPDTVQAALQALGDTSPTTEATMVAGSTLAEQIEHLRITPETLTTEEIYRLWAAFEAPYRPSTAFQVTVIVIQDVDSFTLNQPVKDVSIVVETNETPVIATITPTAAAAGAQLTVTGQYFVGDPGSTTTVLFDSGQAATPDSVSPNSLLVTLPASLQAGTRGLTVQRSVAFPPSSTAHPGSSSTPGSFRLIPTIGNASPIAATRGSNLTLSISPAVGPAQRAVLQIADVGMPIDQRPVGSAPTGSLQFPVSDAVPLGLQPISVVIDGAQSALTPAGASFVPQAQVAP
jgi:predicted secreted protein